MSDLCEGCGTKVVSYGHLGMSCPNPECNYEMEQALRWLKQRREAEELKELERLKAKYED